jgi:hypothetical protein
MWLCLVEDQHGYLGTGGQVHRRCDIALSGAPSGYAIRNYRLVCCDVVRGHVLDRDLLLASASVVVEPLG